MATYLLIHGSFQGAWIWQPTVKLLRAAGHAVYAPTLEGCAERKGGLRPGITVSSAAEELAALLFYEDLREVVIAATSSGGLVAAKLAVLAADRVARIVFIDALVPRPGERVGDIVQRRPGAPPYQSTELARGPSPETLAGGLFAEFDADLQAWAVPRATLHPLGLSDQAPGELDDFWARSWDTTVISCTRSVNPPEAHQRGTAERLNGRWLEMDAGHYPMLTDPEETARLLQL